MLVQKFERNLKRKLSEKAQRKVMDACKHQAELEAMAVDEFVEMFVV